MSQNEKYSGHIPLTKDQYFLLILVCILTAETATRAKLCLVDCLIVFLHQKIHYGVFMKTFNAITSIVHTILFKTFFTCDIAGTLLMIIESI